MSPVNRLPGGAVEENATGSRRGRSAGAMASCLRVAEDIEILGEIGSIETIAAGPSVRIRRLLERSYGPGRWRKRNGIARARLVDGVVGRAEVRWYEAYGWGRVDVKIKRMLSEEP